MTHDLLADLDTVVAQHPHAEFLTVPREWLAALIARQRPDPLPDRELDLLDTYLRAYPPPPRHVLITAAGTIGSFRRDLSAARAAQARLREALVGLVGSSDPDELRAMAAVMRNSPASDEDKAATIQAINAIIATGTPAAPKAER